MTVLVKRLARVDTADTERQFEQLFAAEYATVVSIAYRILADADEAEDVAQSVFLQFHRRHPPDASFAAPWLHKAAAHTAYNTARSRTRRARRDAEDTRQRMEPTEADRTEQPEAALEAAERRREVSHALSRLPEKSALVLMLRYGGLSYAEVAAALGVGVNQVGTLLSRAETQLRKELTRDASR